MSELEFPTIDASTALAEQPAGAVDLTKIDLQAVALAQFNASRAAAKTAADTLKDVVHDLSTPSKLADAKSLRHRLIGAPLADARKVSTALKSKLTAVSKAIGAELVAVEAAFDQADALISPAIKKREDEVAAEKEAARQREEARIAAHKANLAKLAEPVERARGLPSSRIQVGIELVEGIQIDRAAWEEFADAAEDQKAVTLERMRALLANAQAAEAAERRQAEEAAELRRAAEEAELRQAEEKARQDRKAAELKAQEEKLAAERAELERERAAIQAEKDRIAAEAQASADEAARLESEALTKMDAPQAGPAGDGSQKPNGEADDSPAEARSTDAFAPYRASFEDAQSEIMGIQQQVFIATGGRLGVRVGGTIECIRETLAETEALTIGDHLHIFKGAAQVAKDKAVADIRALLADAEAKVSAPAPAPAPEVVQLRAPAANEVPTLTLGEIKARIAPLSIDAAGLELLGYPATKVKAACMYRHSDWAGIHAAMLTKLAEAGEQQRAA